MSVVKEFILFAAGLVITVSLAMIGFKVYSKAAEIGKNIVEQEENSIRELKEYEITRFDGTEIDGSRAISYVKKMYASEGITVEVRTEKKSFVMDEISAACIRDTSSVYYMNPLKKYHVTVRFDENDAVNKITVEQRR